MAITRFYTKKMLLIGIFILALLSIYLYMSLRGEYDIYYLSNDMFINPALNENSIEWEAPYIFNISSKIIDNHFKLFGSDTLSYESARNKLNSVSMKIVRLSDDIEIILGYSSNCNHLIYWNKTRQYCDKEKYILIERDVKKLIDDKGITKSWIWRLRHNNK